MRHRASSLMMIFVLLSSIIYLPSYTNDKFIQQAFGDEPSTCELTSLDELAHQFMNNNAYIQIHSDDGVHPQNTGPGDMAIGEIRGNIGPSGTAMFFANIDKTQQVSDTSELWDSVNATGTIHFHKHTDHIAFTLNVTEVDNVTGIHIHQGNSTVNSSIHLVDLLTSTSSLLTDHHDNLIPHGPIAHLHSSYTGEITVDDLCPGAHDHDDHGDDDIHDFISTLNSEQTVPTSGSSATGTAILEFNEHFDQLSYEIILSGLDLDGGQTTSDDHSHTLGFTKDVVIHSSDTSTDEHDHEDHHEEEPSACSLNSLAALAHEFEHNNAYIQMHTDDGVHPQNTGPGDMTIGEIRGNIGPAGANLFSADINKDNQVSDTPHLWHDVTASAYIEFNTGHHSDHIDFTLTVNNLHNVTGIHIHQGNSTVNSPIHLVDLLTADSSLLDGQTSGPIHHMNGEFTGEIALENLCPGAHDHGGDNGHGDFPEPDHDMTFNATSGTVSGIWDNGDATKLSTMLGALSSNNLYFQVFTVGFPEGAIRGQIIFNNDPDVVTFFASSGFGGSSSGGGSAGGGSGGGGSASAILAPNVIMYNACSEELDGIMRIVTYNQKDRDLRVQLSLKDFTKWAIDVSDTVPFKKYIEVPTERYEYSVFDARFPTDLEQVWVGLYDTQNKKRFIHHLVEFNSNSCMGAELPLPLKDPDATLLRPFEPLEIPKPEIKEPTPFEIMVSYEGQLAQQTFKLITSHKPVFQKFEDPNNLKYIPSPLNDSWNEEKQCFEVGERNRQHCYFSDEKIPFQIWLAQEKFVEITWNNPVRQNFDEKQHYDKIYRGAIWLVDR